MTSYINDLINYFISQSYLIIIILILIIIIILWTQSLDELFQRYKYYSKGNNVAAKAEKANNESVKRTLLSITTPDGKKKLFNYNIFVLFNSNTLSSFCRELNEFIVEIEQHVSLSHCIDNVEGIYLVASLSVVMNMGLGYYSY